MIRTYIDSGVLIYAARGNFDAANLALPFLDDPGREYVTSGFVKLEVIPKAVFHQSTAESDFYAAFFRQNVLCVSASDSLLDAAMTEACRTGISGIDSLHIACAALAGADELITSEKNTRPIHRTTLVRVVSIYG